MNEVWKSIKGYEGLYEVSNLGKVRSTQKTLKPTEHNGKQSYLYVTLSKNGVTHKFFVHRLVADAFIVNPENKKQVNHIDGNPQNNHVGNLEWVTNAENTLHAYKIGLNKRKQKLITFNGKTQNLTAWSKELGLNPKGISWRLKHGFTIERALTTRKCANA